MNFATFCEENDKLMKDLEDKFNEVQNKKDLFRETLVVRMVISNPQEIESYIEDQGLNENDKEQAIDLAKDEVEQYDTRYITDDLGIETENVIYEFCNSSSDISLYPIPTSPIVAEYLESDLNIFDFFTQQSLISINGMNEYPSVLDFEDGFNHEKGVHFTNSEEVYQSRLDDEDSWEDELKDSRDIYDDVMISLKPFLDATHDVEKVIDQYGNGIDFDITDCVLGQLEDFENEE